MEHFLSSGALPALCRMPGLLQREQQARPKTPEIPAPPPPPPPPPALNAPPSQAGPHIITLRCFTSSCDMTQVGAAAVVSKLSAVFWVI